MQQQPNWQQYIDNQLNEQERKTVTNMLMQTEDEALSVQLLAGWEKEVAPMPEEMATQLDKRLKYMLPQKRKLTAWWWAAAAIITGIFLLTSYPEGKYYSSPSAVTELVNNSLNVRHLSLPDKSQIWIAPGTRIAIDEAFDKNTRTVNLSGEGYFEVATGTNPFIVKTGTISTLVLGTHFNVEAYTKEKNINISLTEGKVLVKGAGKSMQINPGTRLIFRKETGVFVSRKFSVDNEASWKRGALVLDDLTLETAFSRLETRFDKKIVYPAGAFKEARFTGIYDAPSLEVVLRNMAFVHGFRYKISRDTIFIQRFY